MKYSIKSILVLVIFSFMCSSCTEKERSYKGELFIKLISVGPEIFDLEYEKGQTFAEKFDTIKDLQTLRDDEKQLKEYYDFALENKLLGKTIFHVIFDDNFNDIYTVYANKSEFLKLDTFKLKTLRDQNQKVYVNFTGQQIAENLIVCKKIENVKKVDGETRWQK